jgi:hypothetical protein
MGEAISTPQHPRQATPTANAVLSRRLDAGDARLRAVDIATSVSEAVVAVYTPAVLRLQCYA